MEIAFPSRDAANNNKVDEKSSDSSKSDPDNEDNEDNDITESN